MKSQAADLMPERGVRVGAFGRRDAERLSPVYTGFAYGSTRIAKHDAPH